MANNKSMYDSAGGTFTLATIEQSVGGSTVNQPINSTVGFTPTIDFTPTLDTSAYVTGDTFFIATAVALARFNDGTLILQSLTVIDKGDQKIPFDLYFFSANVSFGTINVAPSISDADGATCLGFISIASADYKDLGGVDVASKAGLGMALKPASGTQNVYVAAVIQGGFTTLASDIVLRFGVSQD